MPINMTINRGRREDKIKNIKMIFLNLSPAKEPNICMIVSLYLMFNALTIDCLNDNKSLLLL